MQRKLLIDGDVVAYRFASAAESCYQFGDEKVFTSDLPRAKREAHAWVQQIMLRLGADSYIICLSDQRENYFRNKILPSYKAHRTQGRVPEHLPDVKKFLLDEFESKKIATLEADDVMGILATWPSFCPGCEKVIVTYDKDLRTVPGLHFNPRKDRDIVAVGPYEADYNHMTQTLTGDVCDGFKGCPGIGPKKAEVILAAAFVEGKFDFRLAWPEVVAAFEKKGLTEADALVQAQVARICRATDWNAAAKEAIPWTPSSPA